jgi:Co/Zn/Cd efflux system component
MGLLGNDFWDDIVDINDRHKKQTDWSPPPQKSDKPPSNDLNKNGASGLTIFYRSLGSVILIATMIKSWFWSASLFDWILLIIALILIGVHRRISAESAIERIKPAFLDLHNRLKAVEAKICETDNLADEPPK